MTLLILTYHRVGDIGNPLTANTFTAHLINLVSTHPPWYPSTPKSSGELGIYLTFDDATFDFYHFVYPLLKKLNIRVMLGIPTQAIIEHVSAPIALRLQPCIQPYHQAQSIQLCSWREIREMVASGHVIPASHSHTHPHMTHKATQIQTELLLSKEKIEDQLNYPVDTFIYPYGKRNYCIDRQTLRHYRYAMRLGIASHLFGWPDSGLLYRVNMDIQVKQAPFFSKKNLRKYALNFWLNRLRGR